LAAIIVAVPTSKTCSRCGALPARNAAIAAVMDSGYVPLNVVTTLYSFWLALNLVASPLSASPSAPPIECHQLISTCACALPATRDSQAITAAKSVPRMGFLP